VTAGMTVFDLPRFGPGPVIWWRAAVAAPAVCGLLALLVGLAVIDYLLEGGRP
jgi:hypothetical protein